MPDAPPHLCLILSCGWGVKTFLQTDVFEELRQRSSLTLLVGEGLAEEVRQLSGDGTPVEPLHPFVASTAYNRIRERRSYCHLRLSPTWTRLNLYRQRLATFRSRPGKQFLHFLLRLEARLRASPRRYLDLFAAERHALLAHYPHRTAYEAFFRAHRPALVVSTVPHEVAEIAPVLVAQHMGIPTAGRINSWDNLTSKATYGAAFDTYFVWSERMRDELLRYYPEARTARIVPTGVPHFDWYHDPRHRLTRDQFCARTGLDPGRPILLYGLATPYMAPGEDLIVKRLAGDLPRLGSAGTAPQLIIRTHPVDNGDRFRGWAPPADVHLQMPGLRSRGFIQHYCPTADENREFVNTVLHADVVLNVASTLTLDAAVCERPVISVAFDLTGEPETRRRILATSFEDHYRTITDAGAVRTARSYDELLQHARHYLSHPEDERDARRRVVELWCGWNDGRSAARQAAAILAAVGR